MIELIEKLGVIPVIAIEDSSDAIDLGKALIKGGLPICEITFRTKAGKDAIAIMSKEFPEMLVGAGTVLSVEQVKDAVESGAKFIVSPGFDPAVVDYCVSNDILVFPGCVTPSEIIQALNRGLNIVKFFPAGEFGGLKMIKAISGPFPMMRFIPTGGVNADNLKEYLSSNKIVACGGTWIAKKELISNKEFDKIEALAREASNIVKEVRG